MPQLLFWSNNPLNQGTLLPHLLEGAGRPAWRIRTNLALLVVACLLPGVLLSAFFIISDYRQHKAQAIQNAVATARAAAASLDRDIASITAGLRVLATARALQTDDLATFYTQAQSTLPFQNVTNYMLIDATGRQLLDTFKPWGAPLATVGGPPPLQRIFQTGEPTLTDVFIGPVTGKLVMALGVPVNRDGRIVYSLSAGIAPARVVDVLMAQNLPRDWISGVLDSKSVVIARTHEMARFAGKPAAPELVNAMRQSSEGVLEMVSLEGIPLVTVFSRSRVSDWSVAVGIPREQLTGELKRSLAALLVISALAFTVALWVAWRLAIVRVVRPAMHLMQRMQAMSNGDETGPLDMRGVPHEFVMLEQGFAEMSQRLREREREREAKLAAEAANRAKTAFLSRMSHELRTPLNAVLGFTQVLQMDPQEPLSPHQLEMVRHINTAGHHLLDMISDVLDVSRIESGQMAIAPETIDATALVRSCHQLMSPEVAAAGLRLNVSILDGASLLRADPTRLKQVLLNLLSNAIKYNRPDGQITLSLQRIGPRLRFGVSDTGMGMTPFQLQHLFEPFNRLGRELGDTPGAGIGLVICKQLLELMGSTLQVSSQADHGSAFWFEMPAPGLITCPNHPPVAYWPLGHSQLSVRAPPDPAFLYAVYPGFRKWPWVREAACVFLNVSRFSTAHGAICRPVAATRTPPWAQPKRRSTSMPS